MSMQYAQTARALGWGGLIPFAVMPIAVFIGHPDWLHTLLAAYGALILSFLAGTLWTRHLLITTPKIWMLVASNVLVLAAWPALLLPLHIAAFVLATLFAAHLLLDEPWQAHGLPGWYRRLRLWLSLSTIGLLILTGLIGIGRVL